MIFLSYLSCSKRSTVPSIARVKPQGITTYVLYVHVNPSYFHISYFTQHIFSFWQRMCVVLIKIINILLHLMMNPCCEVFFCLVMYFNLCKRHKIKDNYVGGIVSFCAYFCFSDVKSTGKDFILKFCKKKNSQNSFQCSEKLLDPEKQ